MKKVNFKGWNTTTEQERNAMIRKLEELPEV